MMTTTMKKAVGSLKSNGYTNTNGLDFLTVNASVQAKSGEAK